MVCAVLVREAGIPERETRTRFASSLDRSRSPTRVTSSGSASRGSRPSMTSVSDRSSPWRDGARCSCRCGCTLPRRGLGPLFPFVRSAERRVNDDRCARRPSRATLYDVRTGTLVCGSSGSVQASAWRGKGDERRALLKTCGRGARRRDRSIDGLTPSRSRPTPGSRTTSTGQSRQRGAAPHAISASSRRRWASLRLWSFLSERCSI
jgi:hypothetical protein